NVVVDGPGPDFTVFENPFLVRGTTTGVPYAEPGTVSVSADGVHWAAFPCALDAPPYYPGCAGVYPVFANVDDPSAPSPLVPTTTRRSLTPSSATATTTAWATPARAGRCPTPTATASPTRATTARRSPTPTRPTATATAWATPATTAPTRPTPPSSTPTTTAS